MCAMMVQKTNPQMDRTLSMEVIVEGPKLIDVLLSEPKRTRFPLLADVGDSEQLDGV